MLGAFSRSKYLKWHCGDAKYCSVLNLVNYNISQRKGRNMQKKKNLLVCIVKRKKRGGTANV